MTMNLKLTTAAIVFAMCLVVSAGFEEDPNAWVENDPVTIIADKQGSPVGTTCEAVAEDLDMHGALAFVHNSKSGPFHCQQAWDQELGTASVWLRGTLGPDKKDFAVHVAKREIRAHQDGESNEGGTGTVHMHEEKRNLDGSVKPVSKYNKLRNLYELLGAWDVSDPASATAVPAAVLSGAELMVEEQTVSLGHIQETEQELAAYDVHKYKASAEILASTIPSSYNFESENPDCAAIPTVDQGTCGSWYSSLLPIEARIDFCRMM